MNNKTIKAIILSIIGLTFVNVYSQKCNETLELINQSEDTYFSDASLQYNIVEYMECMKAPRKRIDFFKKIVFIVKHNQVYIAKNYEDKYFIINKDFKVIKETENRIGFSDNFNQYILHISGGIKNSEQLIDNFGNPIGEEYDDITFLNNHHIEVLKDKKFGVIDSTGNIIVPLLYSKIESYPSHKNVFIARNNKFKGVINSQNQILLPFEYTEIEPVYSTNFFAVAKDEKFGIVNKNNQVIVPFEHRSTKVVNDYCFIINGDYESFLSDQTGKQIGKSYSRVNEFFNLGNDLYTEMNDYYGSGALSLQTMKEVLPAEYEDVRVREDFISIKNNGLFGITSFDGSILIPAVYEEQFYSYNQFNKVKKNFKYGIIDHQGNQVIDCLYDEIFIYRDYIFFKNFNDLSDKVKEKDYAILVKSGLSQIVDLKTNLVIENYDFEVHEVYTDFFWVKKNGLWGTFNPKTNNFVVEPKYDSPRLTFNNGLAIIQNGEKFGILNFKGEEVEPAKYDDFSATSTISSDTKFVLIRNEKQFLINLFGIVQQL